MVWRRCKVWRHLKVVLGLCVVGYLLIFIKHLLHQFSAGKSKARFVYERQALPVTADVVYPVADADHQYDEPRPDGVLVLLWSTIHGTHNWGMDLDEKVSVVRDCGRTSFQPGYSCTFSIDRQLRARADALVFYATGVNVSDLPLERSARQPWIWVSRESPLHSSPLVGSMADLNGVFNWTVTYHRSADIHSPYAFIAKRSKVDKNLLISNSDDKYVSLKQFIREKKEVPVLWYVSNCRVSDRNEYIDQLKKYIPVDVFGKCTGIDPCENHSDEQACLRNVVKKYLFYFAAENSNCSQYITEKFFRTLALGSVPIAFGTRQVDYEAVAPHNSFLHVDNFTSPKHLAEHLLRLAADRDAYRRLLLWKRYYRSGGKHYLCKICEQLQKQRTSLQAHRHLESWWSPSSMCTV